MSEVYTIGKLVKKFNIKKKTIRYYERVGLLSKPKKLDNGYRVYSEEDINIIWFILITKKFRFTLNEIKILLSTIYEEIIGSDVKHITSILVNKMNEIDKKIYDLNETKKLIQKVNDSIQKNECFKDLDGLIKDNA